MINLLLGDAVIYIIDNKKVDMTEDEKLLYDRICASYDNPPVQKGKDLFQDLFVSDDKGIITCLIPPSKKQTTFEVYFFLVNVFINQHLRNGYVLIDEKFKSINQEIENLKDTIKKLESK